MGTHMLGKRYSEPRPVPARRAVAVVEFALVAPLVTLLLMGLLEVGRMVQINQILMNAAREGARQASSGQYNCTTVNTTVTNYLNAAGITNLSGLQVQVANLTSKSVGPHTHGSVNDYDPSQAAWMDQLQVNVSLPYQNVQWISFGLFTNSGTELNAQALWNSMNNQSYPANVTEPGGF